MAGRGLVTRWEMANRNNDYFDALALAYVAGHGFVKRLVSLAAQAPEQPHPARREGGWLRSWTVQRSSTSTDRTPSVGNRRAIGVPTLGHIQAVPLVISRQVTFDRLACNVTTLVVGGKIMLGLYSNTAGDLYPNTLLASGEVTTDAAGVKEVVVNVTLQPGVYWLTYCGNTNTTLAVRAFAVGGPAVLLGSDATLPTTPTVGWDDSRAYDSTLPATYPTGSPSRITAVPIAAVYVRLSA